MKISKKTSGMERQILIGMVVDKIVLGRIAAKWQENMFRSRWANLVAGWCIRYYNKYKRAPKAKIESLFENWAETAKNKDTISLVEKFLGGLSDEYKSLAKESNSDYVIDLAGKHFNQVKLERLVDSVQGDIDGGKVGSANSKVVSFNKIEMGVGQSIDILQDKEAIRKAFENKKEPLITYPGDLGHFFKNSLERDAFISFMGPEKRGKSWWLIDMAFRAMFQRRRVAFFEAGDMSQDQIMRRLMVRVCRRPWFAGRIRYPISIRRSEDSTKVIVRPKKKRFRKRLSYRKALEKCELITMKKIKTKETLFKLSCHPNSTLNVRGIKSILQDWEREGWIPDVIIIDYADILDMEQYGLEGRDRINEVWKQLRSLSQVYHCLVVTATQSDAASYGVETIRMKHFSEDKRKLAHVTGMIGLNAEYAEKAKDIMRLNWVVLREGRFSESKCIHVAGCLDIGNPAMKSCY